MPAPLIHRARLTSLVLGGALLLAGCSGPPPAAPEPTGEALERAWRAAVGSDPLEQTLAYLYAHALNARDLPTVVVEDSGQEATELALALADQQTQQPEPDGAEDQRYEMVVTATLPLAQEVDPARYEDLTGAGAADPAELLGLIEPQLDPAQVYDPSAAVRRSTMAITAGTQVELGLDTDDEASVADLASACEDLTIGLRSDVADAPGLLEQVYDCEPAELMVEEEDALLESLITGEIDAALLSEAHPGVYDHALVTLGDVEQAFPHDQYVPVVASRVTDQVPEVVDEISAALDDQALLLLRRLIHGDQGLSPEEAAEYWLMEHEFIARPTD